MVPLSHIPIPTPAPVRGGPVACLGGPVAQVLVLLARHWLGVMTGFKKPENVRQTFKFLELLRPIEFLVTLLTAFIVISYWLKFVFVVNY